MDHAYLFMSLLGFLAFFVSNSVAREAIIGGGLAVVNQFPYQVSVQLDGKHACGGCIISDYYILTSAHCIVNEYHNYRSRDLTIIPGKNDLSSFEHESHRIAVTKIVVPAAYNAANLTADIAVLKLISALELKKNKHLKSQKLPPSHEDFVNRVAKIAGFGWDKIDLHDSEIQGGSSDGRLRFAETDVLTNSHCQSVYTNQHITTGHICARIRQYPNIRRGVCNGDRGSPLVYNKEVIGILSINPRDCSEGIKAAIYTRVSHYLEFIKHATQEFFYQPYYEDIHTIEISQ